MIERYLNHSLFFIAYFFAYLTAKFRQFFVFFSFPSLFSVFSVFSVVMNYPIPDALSPAPSAGQVGRCAGRRIRRSASRPAR